MGDRPIARSLPTQYSTIQRNADLLTYACASVWIRTLDVNEKNWKTGDGRSASQDVEWGITDVTKISERWE
jgi:hypothetical protein